MTTNIAPAFIDVYSINDADDSDPDSIYYATANTIDELRSRLIDAMGNVTLDFLFTDDDMHHDVYNVCNADNDVIAVAYIGHA